MLETDGDLREVYKIRGIDRVNRIFYAVYKTRTRGQRLKVRGERVNKKPRGNLFHIDVYMEQAAGGGS